MHRHLRFPLTVVVFPALLTGCAVAGPEPIALNEDACDYCRMTIADARFGGEAVTRKGRAHKFDSIECLAGWARAAKPGTVRALYVLDAQHPGTFVRVEQAGFLEGGLLKSPMGRSLVAFASPTAAEERRARLGGRVLTWADLLADTTHAGPARR
ncbi:MAG TPA: nitrous oxide reductase accessory protein NosL [Gemmatimonadaceae bacterium]|nr:nitrous oxide reductase accessory protein NosL [Gemmatimonadaceae bacterium]